MDPAPARPIDRLLAIMAQLRTPVTGCAWDLEQTLETLAPYAIEEAYEVADAIARGDLLDLRDELGDLLLQVVFQARVAEEQGAFAFDDVADAISAKLVRRHPHIFGDARNLTPDEVTASWNRIKAEEKAQRAAERGGQEPTPSVLDKASAGLPPLTRALALQTRAASVGFDWAELGPVLAKVREEVDEVEDVMERLDAPAGARAEEIGDLLFAAVNLARHAGVDPHQAMMDANNKFARRFRAVEAALARDRRTPADATLAEMDDHWSAAKRLEKSAPSG